MSAELDPIAALRPRLFGLAYRMLGSPAQAEDMVQETYMRWYAKPREEVENEAAYLTSMVTNLCLDQLKSARHQRELYIGDWLPEPIAASPEDLQEEMLPGGFSGTAEQQLEHLQSISLAFLAVLDSLTPLERAVYLLHEVFDYSHNEVADILGRTPAACRQVYHRARKSLKSRRPASGTPDRNRELLQSFISACSQGDVSGLTRLLADDVVSRADGGGKVTAASRAVQGARAVARLFYGFYRQATADTHFRMHDINGWPALLVCSGNVLRAVIQVQSDGHHIQEIHTVLNPDKLRPLAASLGMTVVETETLRP